MFVLNVLSGVFIVNFKPISNNYHSVLIVDFQQGNAGCKEYLEPY